jgi:SAM-dependent methyltransferase
MHTEALNAMRTILERSAPLLPVSAQVLDVGSYDVNGTYRPLVESLHYRYTGLDLTPGPNVDIVAGDPDHYPIPDASYDVVISGSTMEHVARPWRWVPELVRVLRPGGLLAIVTHWQFPEHRYPFDYWRFMVDGMRLLLDDAGSLDNYVIEYASQWDIAAAAWKRLDGSEVSDG